MSKNVTFEDIKNSEEIKIYIRQADAAMLALGFTEHSFAHVMRCADLASRWLLQLDYSEHEADLARIAGYMHDIGNMVNRTMHAQTGAMLAFSILTRMGMPAADVASVVSAIGNHDESSACPVNSIAAALILADKTDVRRSRVRNGETIHFDIHDRVNYAVEKSTTSLNTEEKTFTLSLDVDHNICAVMDYFEIFMDRMLLCRRAAEFFGLRFQLVINGSTLM
ncbi:HD domain-containing protein [Clostridia bacterium OttesenSCG-928-O13]|nr:HD domain-containing protein [Clostridia bacterium OttesenSCG-928-O13]